MAVARAIGNAKPRPDQQQEQSCDTECAENETEFFADYCVDEVGVAFWQVGEAAHTFAQADTFRATGTDRYFTLLEMIRCRVARIHRVEEGQNPTTTVAGLEHSQVQHQWRGRTDADHGGVDPVGTGVEQHHPQDASHHHDRAKILGHVHQ